MKLTEELIQTHANAIGITPAELKSFVDLGEELVFAPGDYLFHESSPRQWFGFIMSGAVDLQRGLAGRSLTVARLVEGAIISESLLLDELPHTVSGLAHDEVRLWAIPKDRIRVFQEEHSEIYFRMVARAARRISARLKEATKLLEERDAERPEVTSFRQEHDSLGEREISNSNYYGIQTSRALENFPFSGIPLYHFEHLITALAHVKKAAASANHSLGVLPDDVAEAIGQACDRVLAGEFHRHFVVDMVQGGAGTSTNMNANEVLANVALEILGEPKGSYERVHPNDHVNRSQSTNDAYPTALKIAINFSVHETVSALEQLKASFKERSEAFASVIKMGRTENQDAVPMTLGQEFAAYARMIGDGIKRLKGAAAQLQVINMGATAIGTGLNSPKGYAALCTQQLAESTGLELELAEDLVEATQDAADFAVMSGALKTAAIQISKICNDLRWASSGPRCGLNEINLPPLQPGSSIMPGKVNPVMPEVVNQICYQIIGSDLTVSMAAEASEFELNMAEPIIAYNLLQSLMLLKNAAITFRNRCVSGITANEEHCLQLVRNSIGIVTALNPTLGYERSAAIAKEALATGASVYDLALEKGWITKEALDDLLAPQRMANPLAHD
ncbi:aspartate ammonia-lyase [Haloferula sp.]|uniref:aspartate ammonia-lyase n=1 Tax=Haloferula sp. TaxID=2497595 RepID=UPI00329C4532